METDLTISGTGASEVSNPAAAMQAITRLLDLELPVSLSLGGAELALSEIVKLGQGSLIELNAKPEDMVDVVINRRVVARGELVVVEGNYGVRIREIVDRTGALIASGAATQTVRALPEPEDLHE